MRISLEKERWENERESRSTTQSFKLFKLLFYIIIFHKNSNQGAHKGSILSRDYLELQNLLKIFSLS